MKKILIGLTLLISMTSFSESERCNEELRGINNAVFVTERFLNKSTPGIDNTLPTIERFRDVKPHNLMFIDQNCAKKNATKRTEFLEGLFGATAKYENSAELLVDYAVNNYYKFTVCDFAEMASKLFTLYIYNTDRA